MSFRLLSTTMYSEYEFVNKTISLLSINKVDVNDLESTDPVCNMLLFNCLIGLISVPSINTLSNLPFYAIEDFFEDMYHHEIEINPGIKELSTLIIKLKSSIAESNISIESNKNEVFIESISFNEALQGSSQQIVKIRITSVLQFIICYTNWLMKGYDLKTRRIRNSELEDFCQEIRDVISKFRNIQSSMCNAENDFGAKIYLQSFDQPTRIIEQTFSNSGGLRVHLVACFKKLVQNSRILTINDADIVLFTSALKSLSKYIFPNVEDYIISYYQLTVFHLLGLLDNVSNSEQIYTNKLIEAFSLLKFYLDDAENFAGDIIQKMYFRSLVHRAIKRLQKRLTVESYSHDIVVEIFSMERISLLILDCSRKLPEWS